MLLRSSDFSRSLALADVGAQLAQSALNRARPAFAPFVHLAVQGRALTRLKPRLR